MALTGKALILGADLFEVSELVYPMYRLKEEGMDVTVAAAAPGPIASKEGYKVNATVAFDDIDPSEYDVLVIPGGFAPDYVRRSDSALDTVRAMNDADKPIAFICHGGWVPVSAGILDGKKATGFVAIKDDMVNAGATYVDEPVVVDGNLVSSRVPGDLGPFMAALVAELESRAAVAA